MDITLKMACGDFKGGQTAHRCLITEKEAVAEGLHELPWHFHFYLEPAITTQTPSPVGIDNAAHGKAKYVVCVMFGLLSSAAPKEVWVGLAGCNSNYATEEAARAGLYKKTHSASLSLSLVTTPGTTFCLGTILTCTCTTLLFSFISFLPPSLSPQMSYFLNKTTLFCKTSPVCLWPFQTNLTHIVGPSFL